MPANYTHTTRPTGLTLTAAIYNADHQNHIDNMVPAIIDDYSVNVAQMQETVDPGEVGTEAPAVSLAEELKQLRFCLKEMKGTTHWYQTVSAMAFVGSANVFSALQKVVMAVAGTLFGLESTDAGSSSGPEIELYRNSASPAANDFLGSIKIQFKDSAANKQYGGQFYAKLLDPTNGSEDTAIGVGAVRAGVASDWANSSGAWHHASLTAPAEEGALAAVKYYLGTLALNNLTLQEFSTQSQTADSTASNIPADTSKPRWDEGKQVFSQAFTPKSATSKIVVEVILSIGAQTTGNMLFATLFKNATLATDVAVAVAAIEAGSNGMNNVKLRWEEIAGSTTGRTYAVRYGSESGTCHLNNTSAGETLNGTWTSHFTIREVAQ